MASSPSFRKDGPISKTRSMPPMINRFSQSSGAILRASSLSENSVATVLKDFAMAPLALSVINGVWTSRKLSLSKNSRICWMICDRIRSLSATSRFTSRSTCRLRTLVAVSSSLVGRMASAGESNTGSSEQLIDSSPESVT